jgi:hypothetical protein
LERRVHVQLTEEGRWIDKHAEYGAQARNMHSNMSAIQYYEELLYLPRY